MIIRDPIHGEIEFEEGVFTELLRSPEMARLHDVEMGGFSQGFFPGSKFSRFEHSVGVHYLLRCAGAPIEEQIYGLLHDVNHTVFSHAVDYVGIGGSEGRQDYQDDHFDAFVRESSIPAILAAHGHDFRALSEKGRFPLAENDIPDLCADRIDYSLRTFFHYRLEPLVLVREMLAAISVHEGAWVFASLGTAARFAAAFARADDDVVDAFSSGVMYHAVGECVRAALDRGIIGDGDLVSTDTSVVRKITDAARGDRELSVLWRRMQGKTAAIPLDDGGAIEVVCKSRIVDPLFLDHAGDVIRLSDAVPAWRGVVREGLKPKRHRFQYID